MLKEAYPCESKWGPVEFKSESSILENLSLKFGREIGTRRTLTEFLDFPTFPELVDRLDLALEGANLGIWDWDLREGSVHFDRRWCEMLGLQLEAVKQDFQTWEERVHPEDLARAHATIGAYLRGETSAYELIHRLRHADGGWVSVLARGRFSSWDEQGRPTRFTGTHCDVTASERARKVMSEELVVLKELVAHFPYPVALLDSNLHYVSIGEKWLSCTRQSRAELTGRSYLYKKELAPFFRLQGDWDLRFQQVLSGESIHRARDSFINSKGEVVTVRWSLTPWGGNSGGAAGVMILFEDITRFVEADLRIQHQTRLASLGEMAGSIAHEINTPLATIALLAGQITDICESLEKSPTEEERLIVKMNSRQIEATVNRISKITRSMLALARSGQQTELIRSDLRQLVEETLPFISERIRLKGIRLEWTQPSEPFEVWCRPTEVGQVVFNLISNSLDSISRQDSSVSSTQPWIRIELDRHPGGGVQLSVLDSGPLIDDEVRSQLFHPYFTTKPVGQGTGIGLALSRKIMERQGGSLAFFQENGRKAFNLDFSPS